MNDKPDFSNPRTRAQIKPAPDTHLHPIDLPPAAQPPQLRTTAKPKAAAAPRDLNLQVSDEVFETIDYAKFKTKLTKRAIVEQAVLAHWSEYRPKA